MRTNGLIYINADSSYMAIYIWSGPVMPFSFFHRILPTRIYPLHAEGIYTVTRSLVIFSIFRFFREGRRPLTSGWRVCNK